MVVCLFVVRCKKTAKKAKQTTFADVVFQLELRNKRGIWAAKK
jgi:hypothetical protein